MLIRQTSETHHVSQLFNVCQFFTTNAIGLFLFKHIWNGRYYIYVTKTYIKAYFLESDIMPSNRHSHQTLEKHKWKLPMWPPLQRSYCSDNIKIWLYNKLQYGNVMYNLSSWRRAETRVYMYIHRCFPKLICKQWWNIGPDNWHTFSQEQHMPFLSSITRLE